MTKRALHGIVFIGLGILLIFMACKNLKNDINIDIAKSATRKGVIEYSHVVFEKDGFSRYSIIRKKFQFKLMGIAQIYSVYRGAEVYQDLEKEIDKNDTVKVYYLPNSETINSHVFQIEKNGSVLQSYNEYNSLISVKSGLALIFGFLFIVGGFFYYRKIHIVDFLNSLVAVKKNKL